MDAKWARLTLLALALVAACVVLAIAYAGRSRGALPASGDRVTAPGQIPTGGLRRATDPQLYALGPDSRATGRRLRVVEAGSQRPIAGAVAIAAEGSRSDPGDSPSQPTVGQTDEAGIVLLPESVGAIVVSARGYSPARVPASIWLGVAVESFVVCELRRGRVLQGVVRRFDGLPEDGARVSFLPQRSRRFDILRLPGIDSLWVDGYRVVAYETTTSNDGTFSIQVPETPSYLYIVGQTGIWVAPSDEEREGQHQPPDATYLLREVVRCKVEFLDSTSSARIDAPDVGAVWGDKQFIPLHGLMPPNEVSPANGASVKLLEYVLAAGVGPPLRMRIAGTPFDAAPFQEEVTLSSGVPPVHKVRLELVTPSQLGIIHLSREMLPIDDEVGAVVRFRRGRMTSRTVRLRPGERDREFIVPAGRYEVESEDRISVARQEDGSLVALLRAFEPTSIDVQAGGHVDVHVTYPQASFLTIQLSYPEGVRPDQLDVRWPIPGVGIKSEVFSPAPDRVQIFWRGVLLGDLEVCATDMEPQKAPIALERGDKGQVRVEFVTLRRKE